MIPPLRLKILRTLLRANRPLNLGALSREVGAPRQKVSYHLPALVAEGVILPLDGGLYVPQKLFRDKRMLDLIEPLIYFVIGNIDASDAEDFEEAVATVLAYFFAIQDINGKR